MNKKKSLIVEHDFFGEKSPLLDVFWPRPGLQANHETVWKSAMFPRPCNQWQLKWSKTAYVNKWSFTFKIKLCVSVWRWFELLTRNQQKYPILRGRWRVNKHGDPIFYCICLMFISWMLIAPSFKRRLMVEQGNYFTYFNAISLITLMQYHSMNVEKLPKRIKNKVSNIICIVN